MKLIARSSARPVNAYVIASLFIAAGLLVYVALRAYLLSFTYDEAVSFGMLQNISQADPSDTANNHLLNMLLMQWSYLVFGSSEFALRLPNVLAFVLFLFAAIKIGGSMKMPYKLPLMMLLTCNPYVLDFFSLARGYGLGLGFMLPSVYFLFSYLNGRKMHTAIIALITGWLALLSNYTLMNYFIPMACLLLAIPWLGRDTFRKKMIRSLILLVLIIASIASVIPILLDLNTNGQLYFGGSSNILNDTMASMARCFFYLKPYGSILKYAFMLLFCAAIAISFINLYFSIRKRTPDIPGAVSLLFLLSLLSPVLQHLLFGTANPVERTALMYYPLMILALFQWGNLYKLKAARWAYLGFVVICCLHFLLCINLTHSYSWRYDSGTKSAFRFLKAQGPEKKIIGVDYVHMMSAMYYFRRMNTTNLEIKRISSVWEFVLGLEELDPYYYGIGNYCAWKPVPDVRKIISPGITYYYLDLYFLSALQKKAVPFRVIQAYPYSRSALIEILSPLASRQVNT